VLLLVVGIALPRFARSAQPSDEAATSSASVFVSVEAPKSSVRCTYVPRSVGSAAEALREARGNAPKLMGLFDRCPVPALMFDAQRRHLGANRPARLWFRRSLEEIRTYRLGDLAPPDRTAMWEQMWGRLLEAGIVCGRYPGARPDRSPIAIVYCAFANALPGRHVVLFAPADWAEDELGVIEDDVPAPPGLLTKREIEVLELAAEGTSIPKLAAELALSPDTVRTHLQNIYGKLGVHNRTGAVTKAMRLGLIDP